MSLCLIATRSRICQYGIFAYSLQKLAYSEKKYFFFLINKNMPKYAKRSRRTPRLRRRRAIKPRGRRRRITRRISPYRNSAARPLQIADLRPAKQLVRFEGKQRFIVSPAITTANTKSVLTVPASFMGDPIVTSGTWTQDNSGTMITPFSYALYFGMYEHYTVLGSNVSVVIRPLGATEVDQVQEQNFCFVTRQPDSIGYSSATTVDVLENERGNKSVVWKGQNQSNSPVARSAFVRQGYKPRQEHGIKDPTDYSPLRNTTVWNNHGPETTYWQIVVCGMLDSLFKSHPECIVELKVTYYCQFTEPNKENTTFPE